MTRARVITVQSMEATLKRKIRAHLKNLGFIRAPDGTLLPPNLDKESYRRIHAHQRAEKINERREWIARKKAELAPFFASGAEIDVEKITPRLELVAADCWQSDLFRLAGLYWRIPISEGYGRRLRFLVWDDHNKKLIGLMALGDAVFNLRARDELIGWDHRRRAEALVNLMDAYVLGAMPPYSMLLGGKLVAALTRTKEVVGAFDTRYRASVGIISKRSKKARLAAITTSSALGRSSIYNRLKLDQHLIFQPIGFTSGWGHFHISDALFDEMRGYLKRVRDPYATSFKFGQGPNWRLRVIRRTLRRLDMDPDLIRHGFPRELFFCPVAANAMAFLSGRNKRIRYDDLPDAAIVGQLALKRWMIPRAERNPEFRGWSVDQFFQELTDPRDSSITRSHSSWNGRKIS